MRVGAGARAGLLARFLRGRENRVGPFGEELSDTVDACVRPGAGFIGTHTVQLLLQARRQVMVIDDFRHPCGEPVPAQVTLVRADVATGEAREALVSFRPSAIIHLAAQGGVSRSLRDPAADATNNVVGTVSLLRSAVDVGCQRIVFASSGGAIYGRARRLPSAPSGSRSSRCATATSTDHSRTEPGRRAWSPSPADAWGRDYLPR